MTAVLGPFSYCSVTRAKSSGSETLLRVLFLADCTIDMHDSSFQKRQLCRFYLFLMLNVCDISDFCDVDPLFDTLAVFDELLARLHARSIKLLPDVVPNHTSSQHSWFSRAVRRAPTPKCSIVLEAFFCLHASACDNAINNHQAA